MFLTLSHLYTIFTCSYFSSDFILSYYLHYFIISIVHYLHYPNTFTILLSSLSWYLPYLIILMTSISSLSYHHNILSILLSSLSHYLHILVILSSSLSWYLFIFIISISNYLIFVILLSSLFYHLPCSWSYYLRYLIIVTTLSSLLSYYSDYLNTFTIFISSLFYLVLFSISLNQCEKVTQSYHDFPSKMLFTISDHFFLYWFCSNFEVKNVFSLAFWNIFFMILFTWEYQK